jgi:hypothetical protein
MMWTRGGENMARITGTAGFGEASDYEAVSFSIDAGEARPEYIQAVTREVEVKDDDGNVVYEDGIARTRQEVVAPGRYETLEEAARKALVQYLVIDELEKGVENITATVNFTITGSFVFDAQDWGLADDLDEVDPEDIDSSYLIDNFGDELEEAAREAARHSWESEVELEVD